MFIDCEIILFCLCQAQSSFVWQIDGYLTLFWHIEILIGKIHCFIKNMKRKKMAYYFNNIPYAQLSDGRGEDCMGFIVHSWLYVKYVLNPHIFVMVDFLYMSPVASSLSFQILFLPRLCWNRVFSRNFGRNRNKG